VSVTIPHKEAVAEMLGGGEPGAVNTVVVREEQLEGYNTDVQGAVEAMGEIAGRSVLVLGSGGVARAIVWGLKKARVDVSMASRTFRDLGVPWIDWGSRGSWRGEIVVNATSVGMNSDESPFPAEAWRRGMRAMDVVYTPRDTRFLREARAAGVETVDGMEMFLRQAHYQFLHFTGQEIPPGVIEEFRSKPAIPRS
jgi:shikimate dehydrogenase